MACVESFTNAPHWLSVRNGKWALLPRDVHGSHCWCCCSFTEDLMWHTQASNPYIQDETQTIIGFHCYKMIIVIKQYEQTHTRHILTAPWTLSDLCTTSVFLPSPVNSDLELNPNTACVSHLSICTRTYSHRCKSCKLSTPFELSRFFCLTIQLNTNCNLNAVYLLLFFFTLFLILVWLLFL